MAERRTLEKAYAAARYRIDCGAQTIERRIGVVDSLADAALAAAGCRAHWSLLTPCNPQSQILPDDENRARLRALLEDLDRLGACQLPALNTAADDTSWSEPGVCALDLAPARVRQLAERYGQLAFVHARLGRAPTLIWIDPPSQAEPPDDRT